MSRLFISNNKKNKINRNIYGHFSEHLGRCIYNGIYVGENSDIPNTAGMRDDVVAALKHIKTPVLRWPGGCFADEYHWRDGIGPKESRKKMINTHWGGVMEDNSFGTHEFMELCRQIECEPYINGNVGSGTVQEMSEWVEYLTFGGTSPMAELRTEYGRTEPWKVKYFGVGNENWGCGGNMRPEYYADMYRRYQTYVRSYGENKIYKIACGPSDFNYEWMETLLKMAGSFMDAISVHYYTVAGDTWDQKGSATEFTVEEYDKTIMKAMRMEELLTNHEHIMDRYDPKNRIGLIVDEWGTWHNVEPGTNPGFLYQQNTMRDAIVAAVTLNIFNNHSRRVVMANIAQTVNVLQAVILTEGSKMLLTPTYHVFDMFKNHQDAELVDCMIENSQDASNLSASASVNGNVLNITIANISATDSETVECSIGKNASEITGRILTGKIDEFNDFDSPNNIKINKLDGINRTADGFSVNIPPCAVVEITVC